MSNGGTPPLHQALLRFTDLLFEKKWRRRPLRKSRADAASSGPGKKDADCGAGAALASINSVKSPTNGLGASGLPSGPATHHETNAPRRARPST